MLIILREELKRHALKAFSACILCCLILAVIIYFQNEPHLLFDMQDFFMSSFLINGLIIGLLQGYFDSKLKARLFIWHRPISSKKIFLGKIFSGIFLYTIASIVPFLLYLFYYIKIHPVIFPFTWPQIRPSIADYFFGMNCYFVGMILMVRNVKWTRSRLISILFLFSPVISLDEYEFGKAIFYILIPCTISYFALKCIYTLPKKEQHHNIFERLSLNLFLICSYKILILISIVLFVICKENKSSQNINPTIGYHFTKRFGPILGLHKFGEETTYYDLSGKKIFKGPFTFWDDKTLYPSRYIDTNYGKSKYRFSMYYKSTINEKWDPQNIIYNTIWSLSINEKKYMASYIIL